MAAHKDTRILFTVAGRRYEAVGFLNEGESSVDGETMLARTAGENGGAIGDEDEAFLWMHINESPSELHRYYLVTNRRNPDNSCNVLFFHRFSYVWCQAWLWLDSHRDGRFLVLRRCA